MKPLFLLLCIVFVCVACQDGIGSQQSQKDESGNFLFSNLLFSDCYNDGCIWIYKNDEIDSKTKRPSTWLKIMFVPQESTNGQDS